jgi:hypothetical protein
MDTLSADEQIKILLEGRAFKTAQSLLGGRTPTNGDYAKLFTVTRRDVQAYVRAHGLPPRACFSRPGGSDGNYLIEEDGYFVVYYQERGGRFEEFRYAERKEAELVMVGMLLGPSGIGLS